MGLWSMMYTGIAPTLAVSWLARKSGRNWYSEMRYAVVYSVPSSRWVRKTTASLVPTITSIVCSVVV